MKIRNGFVSNSSSSSFILHRSLLTEKQYLNLTAWLNEIENETGDDIWSIDNGYIVINDCYLSGLDEKMSELEISRKKGMVFDF